MKENCVLLKWITYSSHLKFLLSKFQLVWAQLSLFHDNEVIQQSTSFTTTPRNQKMVQLVDAHMKCGKLLITKALFQRSVHLKWSCMNLMDLITVINLCQTALSAARRGCFQKYQAVKGSIHCWCVMPHLQVSKWTCVIFSICSLSFRVKLQKKKQLNHPSDNSTL